MKRTVSSILAVVMAVAMMLSMTVFASAAEGRWLDGSQFIDGLVVDGTDIVPDAEGHGFTIVMKSGVSASGYAGALEIADNGEDQYQYLVFEVDAVNNNGWNIAGLTGQPSGFLAEGGKYIHDLAQYDYGYLDILWMSGATDGTMSIHVKAMYLTNDANGAEPSEGGNGGNTETGVESAVAVAAAAVIGAGALIAISRKK